jgi:predicted MFS family arabinose efflux permease
MAAAIGGAGCMPPTYSLVGDYYPEPGPRARAMSVYMLANPLSLLVSFGVGGWLNEHYGWRMAFFLFGVPGLLMAAIVRVSVSEPRATKTVPFTMSRAEPIRGVLKTLWVKQSIRQLLFALMLIYILGFGTMPWYAAFMMRSHHMGTAELGFWFGIILGLGGIVGALAGGYATARWFANDERNQLRFVAVTIVALVPCFFLFLLANTKLLALVSLAVLMVIWNMYVGPTFVILQRLVADDIRATSLAVIMLICNLTGMGLGPQIVGSLSDAFTGFAGTNALRYAILVVSLSAAWSGYHFWRAGQTVRGDLVFPTEALAFQQDIEGDNTRTPELDHT